MSLSPLRNIVLIVALAAMPLIAACGQGDEDQPIPNEDEIAQELDRYQTQAELKPVDQAEVNDVADDAAADGELSGGAREIDVDPS